MGKSTNGPDWIDVEATMRVLSALHGGRVELRVSPEGIGGTGGLAVDVAMLWDTLPGTEQLSSLSVQAPWPNRWSRDFAAHVYGGLLRLDRLIGSTYVQTELPE